MLLSEAISVNIVLVTPPRGLRVCRHCLQGGIYDAMKSLIMQYTKPDPIRTLFGGTGDDTLIGDAYYLDASLHGDDYLDGANAAHYDNTFERRAA